MNLFEPGTPIPPAPPLPVRVEYHIFHWSQNSVHTAELKTREPLALPLEIEGATFKDFIDAVLDAETEFGFLATLTWS